MKERLAAWAFAANFFAIPYWIWQTYINLELVGTFGPWPLFAILSLLSAVALRFK